MGPSFSAVVRDELARVEVTDRVERRAELAGLVLTVGRLGPRDGESGLAFLTQSAALARRVTGQLKDDYAAGVHVTARSARGTPGGRVYEVRVPSPATARRILQDLGLLGGDGSLRLRIPAGFRRPRAAAACLRGLFAGAGHIHPPQRGYHLEICLRDARLAADCAALMRGAGLEARVASRRYGHAVYLKDGDQVVHFLTITGAHGAVLAYEDARIYREVRGQVNRLVNAETANLERAIGAAVRQIRDIQFIDRELGLQRLPPALREVARLRLAHRDLSLRDLGQQCRPPLSKSAVAHRIRRLQELAERLRRAAGGSEPEAAREDAKT